jgi:segregation and condensation protein A
VTFLAILELIKETLIDVVQTDPFGPIHIRAAQAAPGPAELTEDRVQSSGTDDQYNG